MRLPWRSSTKEPSLSGFKTIIYRKQGGLAYIALNRPEVLNAINLEMRDELWQIFGAIRDDPDVLVALIQGTGRAFCAGADITEFGTAPSLVIARQVRWERDLWGLILSISKPLIAVIHGYAVGAGIEMAMCCDLRIASSDAKFGLPEVGLGMIPTAGGSQTLPRLVNLSSTMEMVLTGDLIDAAKALQIGLVHRVVPQEKLLASAEELARKLMTRSQAALRLAKEAVRGGLDLSLEEGLRLEQRLFAMALATEDCAEGIRAYREGGVPLFKNR